MIRLTLYFSALSLVLQSQLEGALVNVILIAGQSNADGRAASSALPAHLQSPQSDVPYFYHVEGGPGSGTLTTVQPGSPEFGGGTFFGPEITLAENLTSYLTSTSSSATLAIIKYANGGTNLSNDWRAGGDGSETNDGNEYLVFQNTVTAGLGALQSANPSDTFRLAGLVWMQGESDTLNATSTSNYESNLRTFISDVRLTYGEIPFVIGKLSSGQTALDANRLTSIQNAQEVVAGDTAGVSSVETDSFGIKSDNLHFDAAGQQALGNAFAQELIDLNALTIPEPSSTGLLLFSAISLFARRRGLA
ncbi:sialate O-acetylesterase [Roseibacillus ishigakijimensis]|uniref:PEP-CTERM sorting domain-containing protein n=1 Tax=Roseibacillus ishigakijimensis TaxID=454146 RepID=A0A934RNT3_9BACT|nr:sialate O-acetylesterase [Roseibacillus ishigakijimensis]MBK1835192.1 PEP-CTERM sorting domain-containing protein [Roseibacillus ishigakijimensis]